MMMMILFFHQCISRSSLNDKLFTYLVSDSLCHTQPLVCLHFATFGSKSKDKVSHTRFQAFSPDLISVYRQSAARR